ncbi:MAG: hypothetical protein ACTIH7_13420 [Brevibacterium aurantiacum]
MDADSLIPGTPLSLGSVAEYVIVIARPVLGFILYGLTKKPKDPEDSLRQLLGDYYGEFRAQARTAEVGHRPNEPRS